MNKIKVLWMNNGDESHTPFLKNATEHGITIEPCQNIAECTERLSNKNEKWHALILNLDYEVKEGRLKGARKETPIDYDFIRNKTKDLPYYLVTDSTTPCEYAVKYVSGFLNKQVYFLQEEMETLFKKITLDYESLIPVKYEKICKFCNYQGLIDILKLLESSNSNKPIEKNNEIPNQVRKVLEWLKNESPLFKGKEIPDEIKLKLEKEKDYIIGNCIDKQPLNIFSKILGYSKYIPIYVKRSSFACVSVNQPGSHYTDIDEAIINGYAPYVTRSLIYELLNILYWCASLDTKTFRL